MFYQVADEKFLVLINDLLASGEIPGLFNDDEVEEIINNMRSECKAAGIDDTRENCWRFFIDKVRRLLKVSRTIIKYPTQLMFYEQIDIIHHKAQ